METEVLKEMPHEYLIQRVQELEEENKKLSSERDNWIDEWRKQNDKLIALRNAIKNIISLVE